MEILCPCADPSRLCRFFSFTGQGYDAAALSPGRYWRSSKNTSCQLKTWKDRNQIIYSPSAHDKFMTIGAQVIIWMRQIRRSMLDLSPRSAELYVMIYSCSVFNIGLFINPYYIHRNGRLRPLSTNHRLQV